MKDLLDQAKDEDGTLKNKYEGSERAYLYMKVFYGCFFIWLGYNILFSTKMNDINQKYLKLTFAYLQNSTYYYFPDYFSDNYAIFDFNILINKVDIITNIFGYSFIMGGLLSSIGYKLGKIIIVISILLNILLVHNIFYFIGEELKIIAIKYLQLLGGAIFL